MGLSGSEPYYAYACPSCRYIVIRYGPIRVAWAGWVHRLMAHDDPWSVFSLSP